MSVKLILIEKEHLIGDVWAFRFKPSEPQHWIAGQYMSVELPHQNPDGKGVKRWFTISSAPFEGIMQITTRMTGSSFKRALAALPEGGYLDLLGPSIGNFTWQNTEKPLLFLAGGIGITAFRSILRQRTHDRLPLNVHLMYSNRTDHIVFKEEFDAYAANNSGFKVDYIVGESLTADRLTQLVPTINSSLVYIAGPTLMVKQLGRALEATGLSYEQLKQDFYPSYDEENY